MRQVRPDLWETRPYSPFEGLTTHAYLWTPPGASNVLFYAPGTDDDFEQMEALGGVGRQYLSHRDEAGPALKLVAERFGTDLHVPAAERDDIERFASPDEAFDTRHVDDHGVEVIPTPGHSPGSTCFLVPGEGGASYLFTGDTMYRADDGRWAAGYIPGVSDADALAESLETLASLSPDLVVSSAFAGDTGAHPMGGDAWRECVAEATATLEE